MTVTRPGEEATCDTLEAGGVEGVAGTICFACMVGAKWTLLFAAPAGDRSSGEIGAGSAFGDRAS